MNVMARRFLGRADLGVENGDEVKLLDWTGCRGEWNEQEG